MVSQRETAHEPGSAETIGELRAPGSSTGGAASAAAFGSPRPQGFPPTMKPESRHRRGRGATVPAAANRATAPANDPARLINQSNAAVSDAFRELSTWAAIAPTTPRRRARMRRRVRRCGVVWRTRAPNSSLGVPRQSGRDGPRRTDQLLSPRRRTRRSSNRAPAATDSAAQSAAAGSRFRIRRSSEIPRGCTSSMAARSRSTFGCGRRTRTAASAT